MSLNYWVKTSETCFSNQSTVRTFEVTECSLGWGFKRTGMTFCRVEWLALVTSKKESTFVKEVLITVGEENLRGKE